jgi:CheY-like chemotaxis protein
MENPAGVQVLLIEDDRADYLLTRQMLAKIEGRPFHLDWVRSGDEALEAIVRTSYDVCLLDYRLGERNGLEVLREMLARASPRP